MLQKMVTSNLDQCSKYSMRVAICRYTDDPGYDGCCILWIRVTLRPNVILSPYRHHQPSKRHPIDWTGYT